MAEEETADDQTPVADPDQIDEELTEEEAAAIEEVFNRLVDGKSLQDALEVQPAYVEAMEVAAKHLYDNGKFDEAVTLIEGILALDAERYYPYLLIGDYYLNEEQDLDQALRYLLASHKYGPEEPAISYKVGETLLRQGEPEQAAKFFGEALTFAGDDQDNVYAQRSKVLLSNMKQAAESFVKDGEIN